MAENVSLEVRANDAHRTPADLLAFVTYACEQLQAPFKVSFVKLIQDEYVSKTDEKHKKCSKGKSTLTPPASNTQHDSQDNEMESLPGPDYLFDHLDDIVITAVFGSGGRLVELMFNKSRAVPRMLIKIIAMCIPYQTCLSRFTIRGVPIKGEIIYEISHFLPQSRITEVILEGSPAPQHNYYMLFELGLLKRISLIRCAITDDDCVYIASKLVYPHPASKTLLVLSLVSNNISDVGACALGQALRSNQTLQYINLSGNQITDIGGKKFLQSLMEFSLTYNELLTKRERTLKYIRLKQETFKKCFKELSAAMTEKSLDEVSRVSRRKTTVRSKKASAITVPARGSKTADMESIIQKADMMANELVGIFTDPFNVDKTDTKDNQVYSLGNMVLCYLNLSYNNLGYETAVELFEVLAYQNNLERKSGPGLLRVIIEGNDMPISCFEYTMIDELVDKAMALRMAKPSRKSPLERSKARSKYITTPR